MNLRRTYSNAVQLLDCIQTITTYKDRLTKVEHSIDDPTNIARLIMRRILKENFGGFNIRKNLSDYALKCEDENVYATLYAARYILSNTALLGRFSPSIKEKLNQLQPAARAINLMGAHNGIEYSFRADGKFFIHVNFLPLMGNTYYDEANFNQTSMNRRIEAAIAIGKGFGEGMKFDPIFSSIVKMVEENSIYHIYENNLVAEINEDFLNFYMETPPAERQHGIRTIYRKYRRIQQAKASEALAEAEKEKPLLVLDLQDPTIVEPVPEPVELRPIGEVPAALGIRAIPVDEIIPAEPAPEPGTITLADGLRLRPARDARPLTGIRITPRGEFEFALPETVETEDGREKSLFVTEGDFMLYMQQLKKAEDLGLKFTSVDLYDDDDEDKDGLYFTTIGEQTVYIVFNESAEAYRGTDYETAKAKFVEVFGEEPEMVKYCRVPESSEFVGDYMPPQEDLEMF